MSYLTSLCCLAVVLQFRPKRIACSYRLLSLVPNGIVIDDQSTLGLKPSESSTRSSDEPLGYMLQHRRADAAGGQGSAGTWIRERCLLVTSSSAMVVPLILCLRLRRAANRFKIKSLRYPATTTSSKIH